MRQTGSLNIDDYRASERTFQILTQVAGRAGREKKDGVVIIQTYNPDNFSIECAKEQKFDEFYNSEIIVRKKLNYPPFCDILLFNITSLDEADIKKSAQKIYSLLAKYTQGLAILYKPMPSPLNKIKNKYRWRIIAKCKFNNKIIDAINKSLEEFYKIKNFKSTVTVDINPTSMM